MAVRADNEKKTITKSMKMSPDIVKHIENEAKKKNMNFSQYMINRAVHGDNSLTPKYYVVWRISYSVVLWLRVLITAAILRI